MDMTMLDVTEVPCETGDVVTFIGSDGATMLPLDDVADRGNVSPYELLVRMRNRLQRHYADV
jgi:alanine racemase